MNRVAVRAIRAHLVRFCLSVLAVALGVAFVAGTFALRTMLGSTFADIIATTTLGDAYVRGADDAGGAAGPGAGTHNRVPLSLVGPIEQVDGVAAALPDLQGPVVLVGADGTAVQSTQAPSFAFAYDSRDRAVRLVAGHPPRGPGEVVVEQTTLDASGLAVGDDTTLVVGGELRPVRVVGVAEIGAALAGATVVFVDRATAEAAFAPDGTAVSIAVNAEPGVTEQQLADRLGPVLRQDATPGAPPAVAITGDEMRAEATESIEEVLGFVTTFLLVFAGVSLFVGAFIIANTFAMWVRQRTRELALLRAVGASPLQVFGSIVLQAALVGVVGAVLGVAGGLGLVVLLRRVMASFGMDLTGRVPLDAFTVVVSVLLGTLVSVAAAAVPARRAALVPPVDALRDEVTLPERSLVRRALVGATLLLVGAAAISRALLRPEADGADRMLGLGACAVVLGVLGVAPVVARGALTALGAPLLVLRPVGRLARGNVVRHPRRTANTAGALMIGMALVGASAVIAATAQASTRAIVTREASTDFILRVAPAGTVPAQAVADVRALPDVRAADAFATAAVRVAQGDDGSFTVTGVDPEAIGRSVRTTEVQGSFRDALARGDVAVQRTTARDEGWRVGDELTLTGTGEPRSVRIGAVIDSPAFGVPLVAPQAVLDELVPADQQQVTTVFVTAVPGTDLEELRGELTTTVLPYVVVTVMDPEQFVSDLAEQVDRVLVILYALLGLSVVIAVLGIVNTLALSVIERTREIGLLRAVGLGRVQLGSTITVESVLTAVFGTAVGLVVGVALAATLPTVFADRGLRTLAVPWGSLLVMLALAVVVGVLAAVWPAIRAARLPVLLAVSAE
ncbi:ABC transporter permease [Cellulomonas chitinilytica]|uniref:ABC transporter permease n=1 Tax=Cellulomonas chitinilytica TaxID=398759 RepID=A0A919P0I1_9CELL|nr:FtsX-like permease family protein [Cellulomonas chitinilytica]GIG19995.1 ABC transporter permease [Cellulomonas chitinilytica]